MAALVRLLMKDSISSVKDDDDFGSIKANVIDLLKVEKKDNEKQLDQKVANK